MSKKTKWLGGPKRMRSAAATLGVFPLASDAMPPQAAVGTTNLNHTPTAWRRAFFAACVGAGLCLVAPGAKAAEIDQTMVDSGTVTLTGVTGGDTITGASRTMPTGGVLEIHSAGDYKIDIAGMATDNHAFTASSGDIRINLFGNVEFTNTAAIRLGTHQSGNGSLIYSPPANTSGNIYLGTNPEAGDISVTNMQTAVRNVSLPIGQNEGGAIYSEYGNIEIGNGNGEINLSGNDTKGVASVIYTPEDTPGNTQNGKVTIRGSSITIDDNRADIHSGAIYTGKMDADITIGNADGSTNSIEVKDNSASGSGGAIQASYGAVTLDAKNIELTGNQALEYEGLNTTPGAGTGSGGAILSSRATTIGDANSTVTISDNSAVGRGGAIYTSNANYGDVSVTGSEITITGNKAGNLNGSGGYNPENYDQGFLGGGAIYSNGDIELKGGAGLITLSGNQAVNGSGGALEADRNITITGNMTAEGNTAIGTADLIQGRNGDGGAIWTGGDVTLNATTGDIKFLDNQARLDGGAIRAGGSVDLEATGGNILFQGNTAGENGAAIWFQNSKRWIPSNAVATFDAAAGKTITFFDSIANNDANGLLTVNKTGAGAVIFDGAAAASPIYGTTTVQEGAFVVRNGASYGADFGTGAGDASFTVASGATLAGGGTGTVSADTFALGGRLDISGSSLGLPGHPAAGTASGGYSTFTVNSGNVNFAAGSQVLFNTYLNEGGANTKSDLLVLNLNGSATTGQAEVVVAHTGVGAETIGDGIQIVQTNDGTSAGAFALQNGHISAGPYEYTLHYGGVGLDATNSNWYLRSSLDCSNPKNAAVCGTVTPEPPGPEPFGPPAERPDVPDYRPETSVDTALPSLALIYGRTMLDTLHERVGEEEDIRGRQDLNTWTPKTGAWARVFDTHGTQYGDSNGIYGSDGPKYDYDFFGIQVGQDLFRKEHDNGSRDHTGLYFAYGYANSNVMHFDGTMGRNEFSAYSLGGYWTHFGPSGWYTDAILQGTYYDTTSSTPDSPDMTTHGSGFAASLEGGKPFRFGHGYFVEPQAQVIYQIIDFADASLDHGDTRVSFSDVDSLTGRIGARLGHDWDLKRDRQLTVWLRPNLWHEFRGNPTTEFSSADGPVPFSADLGGTWGELNLGISGQANDLSPTFCTTSLYANVSYDRSFEGAGYAWTGKVGIRFSW